MRTKCGNCGKVSDHEDLNEIEDYHMRVSAGEEAPAGQCEECGALAYLWDGDGDEAAKSKDEAFDYMRSALEDIMADCNAILADDGQRTGCDDLLGNIRDHADDAITKAYIATAKASGDDDSTEEGEAFVEPTNESRADTIESVVDTFYRELDDRDDTCTDLLADTLHWCRRHKVDFDRCMALARMHHEEEAAGNE